MTISTGSQIWTTGTVSAQGTTSTFGGWCGGIVAMDGASDVPLRCGPLLAVAWSGWFGHGLTPQGSPET